MKIVRLLFAFLTFTAYPDASAEIDVNTLTRGGWNCGSQWCYFFEADGTCDVVGSDTVSMKWTVEPDGSLRLSDDNGNTEYVEISGSSMRWRDGREGYHRPFAEKSNEISLHRGREYPDITWRSPQSANTLADKLFRKSWICDPPSASITFYSTDTCLVSNFTQLYLNKKYLWQALDAESIRLTSLMPPHETKVVKVKMRPDAFDLTDDEIPGRYILNSYYKADALGSTLDMCFFPLGCYGFFSENQEEVKSYFRETFPGPKGVADFSIHIVGFHWTCDGVIITPDDRRVSYVNYPGDNDAIEKSFQYMTIILNNLFTPANTTMGENTRIFTDESPGRKAPLIITLAKFPGSNDSGDSTKNGFVSLSIRSE